MSDRCWRNDRSRRGDGSWRGDRLRCDDGCGNGDGGSNDDRCGDGGLSGDRCGRDHRGRCRRGDGLDGQG